jgi:hypothetical protein
MAIKSVVVDATIKDTMARLDDHGDFYQSSQLNAQFSKDNHRNAMYVFQLRRGVFHH